MDNTKLYGGIIVALVLVATGGVFIFKDNSGITYYLSSDKAMPRYECVDAMMRSDCINGIKASGKRCYYDPDNGRKYKNCPGLWQEIEIRPQNINTGKHEICPVGAPCKAK